MNFADLMKTIGLVGAICTTVAQLPQVFKIIKLKETRDLSLWTYAILFVGLTCWLVYGIFLNDLPLLISNGIGLPLIGTILVLKLKYK